MLDHLSDMMNISKQELIRAFIRDHYGTAFNFSRPSEEYEYDYYTEDEDDFEWISGTKKYDFGLFWGIFATFLQK